MFKSVLQTPFDWIWWIGFSIAIGSAILLTTNDEFRVFITANKSIILLFGIGHMVALTLFGMLAVQNRASNLDVGSRISTMGYLHTLIGTSVALILASNNNSSESADILDQMDLIIIPIGSALITSIIGWAVGTEMERPIYGIRESTSVNGALGGLIEDINNIGAELREASKIWSSNIDDTVKSLSDSTKDLESKFEKTLMVSSQNIEDNSNKVMIKYLASFDNLFQQLDQQINTTQSNFDNTSANATKVMDNLLLGFESIHKQMNNQATEIGTNFNISSKHTTKIMNDLLSGFESILKQMNSHASEIETSFTTTSDSAKKVLNDLSSSYQSLSNQTTQNVNLLQTNLNTSSNTANESISNFIQSFEKLFNTMQNYSTTMQHDFETSVDKAKQTMDKLTRSFGHVFSQMDTVSLQWETHINNMQNFAENSSENLNNLLDNSKKIANEIKDVASGMPNSAQILREVDDILEVLRAIKEKEI